MAVVRRYGTDPLKFVELFNPDHQIDYTVDITRAYRGKAPSLLAVGEAYGKGTAKSWLYAQITDLSEFAGNRDKLSVQKKDELAGIILAEYGYLKLTELMDFFRKFKLGTYGKFYGAIDPITITSALQEFMTERAGILSRLDRQEREKNKWRDPDYIKWRRSMELDRQKRIFYSRNFASTDFLYEEFREIWWLFNMGYERTDHGYINN